jgi:hypothetical protein
MSRVTRPVLHGATQGRSVGPILFVDVFFEIRYGGSGVSNFPIFQRSEDGQGYRLFVGNVTRLAERWF